MFKRARPLADPVTVYLDGAPVEAERGEPIAVALLASDRTTLARSAKLHRPRGPSCLRGGCDGCLARVNGEPNVMTCLCATRGGEQVETQNFVGSRKADLLRLTDWFFPKGIDHNNLMAGVPGVQDLLVGFARKLAGTGRLPTETETPRPARRIEAEALVVGGGPAGLAAASRLAAAGREVVLVDDGVELGGSLLALPDGGATARGAHPLASTRVLAGAAVVGLYGGEALVTTADGAVVVRARATVLATGAHDGVVAVPNDDLPGVMSARALCRLAAYGVVPDGPVALVGDGFWADSVERALGADAVVHVAPDALASIKGTGAVKGVLLRAEGGEQSVKVAVVALALPGAPAFELAAQAGAETRFDPARGYAVVRADDGRCAPAVWAAGECAGLDFDPGAMALDGARVAAAALATL